MTMQADELAARIVLDEDGYPTDDALDAIEEWPYQLGWLPLMGAIRRIWRIGNWAEVDTVDPRMQFTLTTGGWSGSESIIRSLERNVLFWACCWVSSHRGGKHVFETLRK